MPAVVLLLLLLVESVTNAGLASVEKPDKEYPTMREYGRLLWHTVHLTWGQPKPKPSPPRWRLDTWLTSFWRKC